RIARTRLQDALSVKRHTLKAFLLARIHGAIQGVSSGHNADKDQHYEPHAFLPVIRAVSKAHARASQNKQTTNPKGRWRIAFWLRIERRTSHDHLEKEQKQPRTDKPDERRKQQRLTDIQRLLPVDAA